jgi:hypothetical protein
VRFLALYPRFLIALIAAQFYAAGLGLFGATSFVPHAIIGWSFILFSTVLLIAALVSPHRRSLAGLALLVLLLSVSQPAIVFGLRPWPAAAAIHPLVGLIIVASLVTMARKAGAIPRLWGGEAQDTLD